MRDRGLYCRDLGGDGPPLVVLHGLHDASSSWAFLGPALAGRARVLLLDLRGHGRSPQAGSLGAGDLAADVEAFLDRRGLTSSLFLGHSLGGFVAMWLALARPRRVAGLVVVDVAPRSYVPTLERILRLLEIDPSVFTSREQLSERIASELAQPDLQRFLERQIVDRDGKREWRLSRGLIARAVRDLGSETLPEGSYRGPTLFLRGASSPFIGRADEELIAASFPAARIRDLPGQGHWLHETAPEEIGAAVGSFVSDVAQVDRTTSRNTRRFEGRGVCNAS